MGLAALPFVWLICSLHCPKPLGRNGYADRLSQSPRRRSARPPQRYRSIRMADVTVNAAPLLPYRPPPIRSWRTLPLGILWITASPRTGLFPHGCIFSLFRTRRKVRHTLPSGIRRPPPVPLERSERLSLESPRFPSAAIHPRLLGTALFPPGTCHQYPVPRQRLSNHSAR